MARVIRLQSDSNAHDRPWRVAVEQGFFAAEGLTVEYNEDNPKGVAGRVENFSERWKESQLQQGALEVYPVCEWGAIERVQSLGKGRIIGLDTTARTGAIMVRKDSKIEKLTDLLEFGVQEIANYEAEVTQRDQTILLIRARPCNASRARLTSWPSASLRIPTDAILSVGTRSLILSLAKFITRNSSSVPAISCSSIDTICPTPWAGYTTNSPILKP